MFPFLKAEIIVFKFMAEAKEWAELAEFMLSSMLFAKKSSSSAEKECDSQEDLRIYRGLLKKSVSNKSHTE